MINKSFMGDDSLNVSEIYTKLTKELTNSKVLKNEPMKLHTTFKIGGVADIFVKATSIDDIKKIIKFTNLENIPLYIVGNGSNLLVKDGGIQGIVLKIDLQEIEMLDIGESKVEINVGAGVPLGKLAQIALKNSISGLEELAGIPGTIGGAVRMNAGAYGKEIKDILISTKYIDYNCNINEIDNNLHEFKYRNSIFSTQKYIILESKLRLEYGNKEEIKTKMDEYSKSRKEKQPVEYPSAGSTFKRGEDFITAKLIDECGLKGYKIGGAEISSKHAGFVINSNNATAKDVLELIKHVQKIVLEKFNKKIELEIEVVGKE